MLADFYFADARLTLVPIEHLSRRGLSAEYATLAERARGWTAAHVALFDAAFSRYWERTAHLASQTTTWAPPRLRHVGIIHEPMSVHPYMQMLNTSAWTTYACDFDPATSDAELAAYVLVHGDRMALTGEVTAAALHNAAYWFDRSDAECASFAHAAERSTRPDADAFRALAAALPWMRQLSHETLRPAQASMPHRAIPRTGLLVPQRLEAHPPALVDQWTAVAETSVATYHRRWRASDLNARAALCAWLEAEAPALLITAADRVVWDPAHPDRLGALRGLLRAASGAAVADVHADLHIVNAKTRAFHTARIDSLPPLTAPAMSQTGYTFVHATRGLIAYNLHEPGMERLRGPALPFAREMLAARTIHEWAHLAVDAGDVPSTISSEEIAARQQALPQLLAPISQDASMNAGDLLRARLPDFQANLLAQRFLTLAERETYVRHNVRTLRGTYPATELWRGLLRYLVEYQYLRFSAVADARTFFLRSTWFDADFIATRVIDDARFDALASAVRAIFDAYAVDERRYGA